MRDYWTGPALPKQRRQNRGTQLENSFNLIRKFKIWTREREGQDLIEPALLAGFVVVAAGAIVPGFANDIREILVKIPGMMPWTATNGSLK
jgi:pilus assembly protein Flp/PilA